MFMFDKNMIQKIRRRDLLALAGKGVIAVAGVGLISNQASADSAAVSKAMKKNVGDKSPTVGRISMELPQIAENGNTVPIAVEVQSPMTGEDHVKALHVYAEGNPQPDVATFRFTPQSGKARISTRMRMIKSQNIVAVAEMSDGSVYMGKKAVKVTIGGCGG
tara:strand:- start:539 stop:1024 length:486 start_codon:yes stop_codon:yes gene_type:complete